MAILIVLLLIAVGYASHITAGITGCIACIVEDMCCDILFISANRALIPMAILIVLLLVAVSYHSHIAAGVASCIARVVEDMSSYVLLFMTY